MDPSQSCLCSLEVEQHKYLRDTYLTSLETVLGVHRTRLCNNFFLPPERPTALGQDPFILGEPEGIGVPWPYPEKPLGSFCPLSKVGYPMTLALLCWLRRG